MSIDKVSGETRDVATGHEIPADEESGDWDEEPMG